MPDSTITYSSWGQTHVPSILIFSYRPTNMRTTLSVEAAQRHPNDLLHNPRLRPIHKDLLHHFNIEQCQRRSIPLLPTQNRQQPHSILSPLSEVVNQL